MDSNSEKHLVENAQHGCIESFGILYERYYNAIAALGFAILNDRQLAEDAAQETFAIACKNISNLKSKDKFASWLAGICRNVSRQMLRTDKAKLSIADNKSVTVSSQNDENKSQTAIRKALVSLKEKERELITLKYYDNLPYEQIASVLNISVLAVHGRLIRTKRKIAKYLKHNGIAGDNHE